MIFCLYLTQSVIGLKPDPMGTFNHKNLGFGFKSDHDFYQGQTYLVLVT